MTRIALLGVGAMSSRLATSLATAGHEVVLWNRTHGRAADAAAERGLIATPTIAEAVTGAGVVLAVLRDDEASRAVWTEALPSALPDALCLDATTLSPARAEEFVAQASAGGRPAAVVPMVGSLPQADAGALIFLAGGPGAQAAADVLGSASAGVRIIGSAHDTALAKLVVNTALATQTAMMAEVAALADSAFVDPGATLDQILDLPTFSAPAKGMLGRMRAESYAPNFTVALMRKDLGYAIDAARGAGLTLPLSEAVLAEYAQAEHAGLADLDLSAVRRLR